MILNSFSQTILTQISYAMKMNLTYPDKKFCYDVSRLSNAQQKRIQVCTNPDLLSKLLNDQLFLNPKEKCNCHHFTTLSNILSSNHQNLQIFFDKIQQKRETDSVPKQLNGNKNKLNKHIVQTLYVVHDHSTLKSVISIFLELMKQM